MIRKTLLLCSLYYTILLISACCNCPPVASHRYKLSGMYTQTLRYEITGTTVNKIFQRYTPFGPGTFGFQARFSLEYLVRNNRPCSSGLISGAYACKCIFDRYYGLDSAAGLSIRTLRDFDASHPAGSDITDYFQVVSVVAGKTEYRPVDALPIDLYESPWADETGLSMYLSRQPEHDTVHQFALSIHLQDGRTLEDSTDVVTIRR